MTDHVVLVGLMGVGKSTVGRALADELGAAFVDVDLVIESGSGMTVRELWEHGGEQAFRGLEREVTLDTLRRADPVVLAAPGGVVLDPEIRAALAAPGVIVLWLRAPIGEIAARVRPGDHRPLLGDDPAAALAALAQLRLERYAEVADCVVDVDGMDAPAAIDRALAEVRRLRARH